MTGANNSSNYLYDIYPYYNFMDRTDYNITDKLKFFARYSYLHTTETTSDYTGTGSVMRYFQLDPQRRECLWRSGLDDQSDHRVRRPHRLQRHQRFLRFSFDLSGRKGTCGPGPNNWYASYLAATPQIYFPNINITQGGGSVFGSSITTYWQQTPQTPSVAAKISKNIGRHYVRAGGRVSPGNGGRGASHFPGAIHLRCGTDRQHLQLTQYGGQRQRLGHVSVGRDGRQFPDRHDRTSTFIPPSLGTLCRTISRSTRG